MNRYTIRAGLMLAALLATTAYADTKISALPAGTTLAGTEPIPTVQSAATVATTPADINTYVKATGTQGVLNGGTGLTATLQGDLLYSAADNGLSRLAKNTNATRYLSNQGTSNGPSWSSVNLSNGVTGDLTGTTRSGSNYALTGSWTWNTSSAPIIINTTAPRVEYIENDAGTDLTFWDHIINGGVQSFRTRTDADGTGKTWLSVTRTSTTAIAAIAIGNATDSPPVTINGTTILLPLSATTASIAPGALAAGACGSGTVAVTNSTTSMVAIASPNTYPGDAVYTKAQVTSNGTVTVKVCVSIAATPTGSTYNVRVIQ